ncbi:hypothetical protein KKH03_01960 [Patescibacteria group bacterium]|nr:hypothetical protein [Patescibacteria group bacterium]
MKKIFIAAAISVLFVLLAGCQPPAQTGGEAQPGNASQQTTTDTIQTTPATGEVGSAILDEKSAAEREKQLKEESATLQTVVEKGDIADCSKISDANWRSDCIYNITVQKVNETGDKTLCNVIEDPMRRQTCTGELDPIAQ